MTILQLLLEFIVSELVINRCVISDQ